MGMILFELVWRIILSSESRKEGKSDNMGSIIHCLSKRMVGWFIEVIYGYPYLKCLIILWPYYWKDHIGMMNEAVHGWNQNKKKSW